jgi:hypothetical protein
MELSVPDDKLIALSGIAKYGMPRMSSTYVAGMWREQLERSLLWHVNHDRVSTYPVAYCASSWSWASVDGHMIPGDYTVEDCLLQVEDVVFNHAGEDMTGAVTGGWLDMLGTLKPLSLRAEDYGAGPEWPITIDHCIAGYGVEEKGVNATINLDVKPIDRSAFESDNAEGRLFYLPTHKDSKLYHVAFVCLPLRLVETNHATYKRIGVVTIDDEKDKEQVLKELDEETKAHLSCPALRERTTHDSDHLNLRTNVSEQESTKTASESLQAPLSSIIAESIAADCGSWGLTQIAMWATQCLDSAESANH